MSNTIEVEKIQTLVVNPNEWLVIHYDAKNKPPKHVRAEMINIRDTFRHELGHDRVIVVRSDIEFSKLSIEQIKQLKAVVDLP